MARPIENRLIHLGLSSTEARVYLASLESGPDTVMHLAAKAGIKRPTCYVMIEVLLRRGLMSSFTKGKKRYFSAVSPEKLFDIVHEEKLEVAAKDVSLREILPELISLFNISEKKPKVRFFEGKEGIRAIQEDILRTDAREIFEFVALDPAYHLFPPGPSDHRAKIVKKYKTMRLIYTSSRGKVLPAKDGGRERRFVPEKKFPFSVEINIYGNKVAMVSPSGTIIGVIIESEEIAEAMKSVFRLAWEAAEKYNR